MAITGVLRPGHMQLKVLDLDESVEFYTNVARPGADRPRCDRAYFKGWDERDHNSIILRDAGEAGMDFYGFKVARRRHPRQARGRPQELRRHDRAHPGRRPARDRRARPVRDPVRSPDRAVLEKTDVGNGSGYIEPAAVDAGVRAGHRAPSAWTTRCSTGPTSRRCRRCSSTCSASTSSSTSCSRTARPTSRSGCRAAPRPTTSRSCATRSPASCTTPPSCSRAGRRCCVPPTSCR